MYRFETSQGIKAVTDTALAYRLLSKYTAFVAVTQEVRVDPYGKRQQVQVPVEIPEGMNAEQTNNRVVNSTPTPNYTPTPATRSAPSSNFPSSSTSAPEPNQILGNILAILLLGIYFAWKRLKVSRIIPPRS